MPLYYNSLMKRRKERKELLAQENGRNCTSTRFLCITISSSEYSREGKKKGRNDDLFQGEKPSSFTDYLNDKKSKIKLWWHAK
jgi:hypothetical protein